MNESKARAVVYERSGYGCEVRLAGICRGRTTNFHHRKAAGRVWTPSNGLHTCGSGTTGCHGWITEHPKSSYARGWMVRSTNDPAEVAVWYRSQQWVFLGDDGSVIPVADMAVTDA